MIINWGDAPFKAFITVTYPSGTCTVTLGDKSYSHSGGGTTTFTVNKKGTWAVSASDTNASISTTVSIEKRNESKTVTLKYTKTYTVNLSCSASESTGYEIATDFDAYSTKINMSAYKTMKFTVTSRTWSNVGSGYIRFGVNPSKAAAPTKYTAKNGSGATTVTVDISSITSGYIGISCSANSAGVSGTSSTGAKVSTVTLSS